MIGTLIPINFITSFFRNDDIYSNFTIFSLSEVYLTWITFDLVYFKHNVLDHVPTCLLMDIFSWGILEMISNLIPNNLIGQKNLFLEMTKVIVIFYRFV